MKPQEIQPENGLCLNCMVTYGGFGNKELYRCSVNSLVGNEPCRVSDWLSCAYNKAMMSLEAIAEMVAAHQVAIETLMKEQRDKWR